MSPEQQCICIAEACGWLNVEMHQPPPNNDFDPPYEAKAFPRGMRPQVMMWREIPDYLNDLNAMHEAEKTLDRAVLITEYGIEVLKVIERTKKISVDGEPNWGFLLQATAAQRAEAFLKTISKWVEE